MENERIVLLNSQYEPIGSAPKLASHHANTPLHLAFSSYVFGLDGKLLVTRRAASKKVWPAVWTNTCCGHPTPNETMEQAIARRLDYELGMTAYDVSAVLPTYSYKTPPFNNVIENEFCPVYFARTTAQPLPRVTEVGNTQWLTWDEYVYELEHDDGDIWSWWCKDQLKVLATNNAASTYRSTRI